MGGLLALGAAWAGAKRYMQRWFARQLADAIPRDMSAALVLARNHGGEKKTSWLMEILTETMNVNEKTRVLDIAGGTHLDLLGRLLPIVRSVDIYDGQYAFQFLKEKAPFLVSDSKLNMIEGESLLDMTKLENDEFDVVILMDVLHRIPPEDQQRAIEQWIKLVSPSGGQLLIIIEEEPLTDVSQAGLIQGLFHRMPEHVLRNYIAAAAEGITLVDAVRFPEEYRVALVYRRGQVAIDVE